jgi:excisionase family DNA binding protein
VKKRTARWREVMTMAEVERYLRVTRKTIAGLVQEGRIPGVKVGRSYRFLKVEIDRFLAGGKGEPKARRKSKSKRKKRARARRPIPRLRPSRQRSRPSTPAHHEEIYVVE